MTNLLKNNKKLMNEYNYEKNKNIDLNKITLGSNKKIWWKCEKGHEYEAMVINKAKETNCPYCSNKKILAGYNDLATLKPDLLSEWIYEKNVIKPDQVGIGSSKKVWWRCKKGHEWEELIKLRTQGLGCPYCSGHRVYEGFNDIATTNPELLEEWDYNKNKLKPTMISKGSSKKVWWKCKKCNGEYEMPVAWRAGEKKNGCPYCSGRKILKGYNDFQSQKKEYMKYWDYEKNKIKPDEISGSTHKELYWKCPECLGEWKMSANRLTTQKGCPYCSGRRVLNGYNDLVTKIPDLAKEWDYKKNKIKPDEVTIGSEKEVWWICSKCHGSYQEKIYRRKDGALCPYCSSKILLPNFNDLKSVYPDLAKEWDYEKNKIKPENITAHSGLKVWWKCPVCKHTYQARINDRTRNDNKKTSCPYCAQNTVIKGYNDLKSQCPELMIEWDYDKNTINPDEIGKHSTRKVWWICKNCGHHWITTPENRVRDNNGCPKCNSRVHTSFPEQAIYYYVKKYFKDAINSYKDIFNNSMELDIFIPSKKVAIEYDGKRWHYGKKSSDSERKKYEICKNNNIRLIRVVERKIDEILKISDEFIISEYIPFKYNTINSAISELLVSLGVAKIGVIDADKDASKIQKLYLGVRKNKSILSQYPELKQQWNYEKNKNLNPEFFTAKSSTKVWWICPVCGKDFEQRIRERTRSLKGCQKCSYINRAGKRIIEIETGKIFNSEKELSIYLNKSHSYASHIIRNNIEVNGKHYRIEEKK